MTPRERILTTLSHRVPDRTPTDGWFHQTVQVMLKEHYRTDDWDEVLGELGIEGWSGCGVGLKFPEYQERVTERPGPEGGRRAVWLDERTYEDAWGVRHRIGESGWYEEWVDGPLTTAQSVRDIEEAQLPDEANIAEPDNYAERVAALKAEGSFITGDIAMQDRIVMGPDTWRQVDKPRMKRLLDDCRAVNPDVLFFIHSDGDVTDLLPDFVELGFDVVNPLQPECMDLAEVKREWGDRVVLHGGISLQETLPFGTVAEVREEVENLIRTCGYDGGLVVFPSNVIQPDTPVENIIACFHAARDFDLASLGGKPG